MLWKMSLCKSYLVVWGKFEKSGCANDAFIKCCHLGYFRKKNPDFIFEEKNSRFDFCKKKNSSQKNIFFFSNIFPTFIHSHLTFASDTLLEVYWLRSLFCLANSREIALAMQSKPSARTITMWHYQKFLTIFFQK